MDCVHYLSPFNRVGGKGGTSRNWEDGRSTGKVFSGLRRMSEDSGAGTQPGSCGPQEGIPGASLDSSGSGRGPGWAWFSPLFKRCLRPHYSHTLFFPSSFPSVGVRRSKERHITQPYKEK
eukprot:scaffold23408_cov118-Isochrysis_galbana.AAC.1